MAGDNRGAAIDERQLIDAFVTRRDERAFVALYRRHAPAVYAFLRQLLVREADDALQDVWLRAARDLHRFRGASALRTWLFGIAVNRAREIVRARREVEEEMDVPLPAPAFEQRIDLQRAVERLPFRYREVFVLHDVYEHTHAEIASLLGIDEGTSKSNLSRARARLRELMGDQP